MSRRGTVRKKIKSLRTPRSSIANNPIVVTRTRHSFYGAILGETNSDYRPLLRRLVSIEPPSMSVIVLTELFSLNISPSFFNSTLYQEGLAKAMENHATQVNAEDFICSHFLRTMPHSTQKNTVKTQPMSTQLQLMTTFNIITKTRSEQWKNSSLYSIGPLFTTRRKTFILQALLSRLEKLDLLDKVAPTDLAICNSHYLSLHNRTASNPDMVEEIYPGKFDVLMISSSGNTFGAVNRAGEVLLHGERSLIGPACLGNITAPKEWRSAGFVENILGNKISQLVSGPHHFCAITECGSLITWGLNVDLFSNDKTITGQLGHCDGLLSPPVLIKSKDFDYSNVISAACGFSHTLVLTTNGVYSFGSNSHQQLGRPLFHGTTQNQFQMVEKIPEFLFRYNSTENKRISSVSCGSHHCVVISSDGYAWAWGDNILGQCGSPDLGFIERPHMITPPEDNVFFIEAACGNSHTLLLSNEGEIFSFGNNLFGQLGIGYALPYSCSLQQVVFPGDRSHLSVKIACGMQSSSCVVLEGIVFRWGIMRSADKQNNQFLPLRVDSCYQQHMFVTSIADGIDHTIVSSESKLSQALSVFTQCCRFEYNPRRKELSDALNEVPPFLLGPIQHRAAAWLHEMYNLRPFLLLDSPSVHFDIIDSRNLADTLITLSKIKTTTSLASGVSTSYEQSLCQEIMITNPLSKVLQVDIFVQKYELPQQNFELTYKPNQFILNKQQTKNVQITLRYSRKEPPPPQHIILAITSTIRTKKSIAPNPSGTCRQFAHIRLRTIQRQRKKLSVSMTGPAELEETNSCIHLAPYLPHILLSRFHKNPSPPTEPFVESFAAAILFVDISGFTSLNEKLAELGPAGPERVSHHINSYFTSLIKAVNDYGGDTLKFAGDALICMFGSPTTSDSLETLTRRATQCALTIQTCLSKYDSNQGFTLTLHVGIGAGTIYALYVGGVRSSWEFLVTGEPLAQLRTCVDLSSAGEVCVSSRVWELICEDFDGELIEDSEAHDYLVHRANKEDIPAIPLPELIPEGEGFESAARCFIPQAVQVQIDSNQTEWMDELRVVTVLFVKLNSEIPSNSMEEFCQHLQHYLVIMQTEIFRFEGMVRQFLADDKGTVLIAAFGLPPSSHMDGGLRAVRAAMAIHENLKKVNMENSIGITTGHVFCGAVGAINRREYAMVGDTVNLSARLMVAAGKMEGKTNILCDLTTAEGCKGKQTLNELDSIFVKGKSIPIRIFHPDCDSNEYRRGRRRENKLTNTLSRKHFRACVGRESEINAINNQLRAVISREIPSLLVLLQGESGTGKTTIIGMLQCSALRFGCNCFLSTGDSIATSNPFYAWRAIIESVIKSSKLNQDKTFMDLYPDHERMFRIASKLCGPQYEDYMSLLQQVIPSLEIPVEAIQSEATNALNANQKQLRLTHMITQMIVSRSKEGIPLFIIIDDLQWADYASLNLLSHLLTTAKQVFFLCAMRPLLEKETKLFLEIEKLSQGSLTTVIKLNPFTPQQTRVLVKEVLSVDDVSPKFMELLNAAQGSPMYLSEIIYHLVTTKAIVVENKEILVQTDIENIKLPDTLHDIVAGRFDNFSQTVQMLLKVASVIGLEFPVELLQRIYNKSMDTYIRSHIIVEEIQIACDSEFIHQDPRNARVYIFNNSNFQQVAYSRLLFSQRTRLHREIAKHFEGFVNSKTDCIDVGVLYPALHHHWNAILSASIADKHIDQEALGKTILYLKLIGEYTSQLGDDGAVSYFSNALEKTKLITEKEERIKRQKELKLKIIGSARKISTNFTFKSSQSPAFPKSP